MKEASAPLRAEASARARDLYNFCFDRGQYKEDQVRREAEARIRETERLRAANDSLLLEEETYQQAAGAEGYFPGTGHQRIEGVAAGDSYEDEDGQERKDGEREERARPEAQEPFRFNPNVVVMEGAEAVAANITPASGDAPSILSRIGDVAQELFGISSAEAAAASAVVSGGLGLGFEIPAAYALRAAALTPVGVSVAAASVIGIGLQTATDFEAQHPWIDPDFLDKLNNPLISEEEKAKLWQQMQNDPLLRDRSDNKSKPQIKPSGASTASPMPDPGDFEPEEEENDTKKFKTSNFERNDNVGLHRFTERFEKTKFRDPKTKQYIEKDRAFNSGSGPHDGAYKLFDKSGRRIGTVNKQGKWLRG